MAKYLTLDEFHLTVMLPRDQPKSVYAGVTAILECLAMGKAVICSRVPGQTDVVVEDENGRYVPPGDPSPLSKEIRSLLSRAEEAVRMGASGRKLVERQMNLDLYVQRLAGFLHEAIAEEGRRDP